MQDHSCSLLKAHPFPLQEVVPPLDISGLKKQKHFLQKSAQYIAPAWLPLCQHVTDITEVMP